MRLSTRESVMTEVVIQKNSGYARMVLGEAFQHWSARLGLIWIGVIALFAVFAPFIANSHPYLIKVDGMVSSPLLRYLTPADVIILVIFTCQFLRKSEKALS